MDTTIYDGHPFACACGEPHIFYTDKLEVLRELAGMRLVVVCPNGEAITCVKVTGLFKFRGFKSLFGTRVKPPEINAATAKIDDQVYLMNYRDHYADILGQHVTPARLAELFLFRGWTAQFGYRVFSSDPEVSEKLIGETVNASKYVGLAMFRELHGFDVESVLGMDFISLIEDRWRDYDVVVATMPKFDRIPTREIIAVLDERLDVGDLEVFCKLSFDFLAQLDLTKRTAMEIGLLGEGARFSVQETTCSSTS